MPPAHPPRAPGDAVDRRVLPFADRLAATAAARAGPIAPVQAGPDPARPTAAGAISLALHPNRELPVYAAEAADGPGAADCRLEVGDLHRFVRAHHVGGFSWLLRDRLADGQVAADDELLELSRWLGARWRDALAEATGDAPLADHLVADAVARWRAGTPSSTACWRRGGAPGAATPRSSATSWAGSAFRRRRCCCGRGGDGRGEAFRHAHDLFLLSLQAVDDVIDRDEDRALRGSDVPSALGCSPARCSGRRPSSPAGPRPRATEGGFTWFASWLEAFARARRLLAPRGGRRRGRAGSDRHRRRDRGGDRARGHAGAARRAPRA